MPENTHTEGITIEGESYSWENLKISFQDTDEEYPIADLETLELRNPEYLDEDRENDLYRLRERGELGELDIYSEGSSTLRKPQLIINDGEFVSRPLVGNQKLEDFKKHLQPVSED